MEKDVENDDDFKVELKKKKLKKNYDQPTSQAKVNRKKKNPKKTTKDLDYDSADDFQIKPNSKESNIYSKVKSVPPKSSPKKQISSQNKNFNPEKVISTITIQTGFNETK